MILILLILLPACAAPRSALRIEEKAQKNVSDISAKPSIDNRSVNLTITPEDDDLDKEIKQLLADSQNQAEPTPKASPKPTTTKPKPIAANTKQWQNVKGSVDLTPSRNTENDSVTAGPNGTTILKSCKGFVGWIGCPQGTIDLSKPTASTTPTKNASGIFSGPLTGTNYTGTPYEALLRSVQAQDNRTRR